MGKLQATSMLRAMWVQPPAKGLSKERDSFFITCMLQLPTI
jgi:hypothetical protein